MAVVGVSGRSFWDEKHQRSLFARTASGSGCDFKSVYVIIVTDFVQTFSFDVKYRSSCSMDQLAWQSNRTLGIQGGWYDGKYLHFDNG